jgi:hypothetical protein
MARREEISVVLSEKRLVWTVSGNIGMVYRFTALSLAIFI